MTTAPERHDGGQPHLVLPASIDLDSIVVTDMTTRRPVEIFTVDVDDDGVMLGIPDGVWPRGHRRYEVAYSPQPPEEHPC